MGKIMMSLSSTFLILLVIFGQISASVVLWSQRSIELNYVYNGARSVHRILLSSDETHGTLLRKIKMLVAVETLNADDLFVRLVYSDFSVCILKQRSQEPIH